MTHRVGPKGQVVIPKDIRDALGLRPGSKVVFEQQGDTVVVAKVGSAHELIGAYAAVGSLTDELERARAEERQAEERRDR